MQSKHNRQNFAKDLILQKSSAVVRWVKEKTYICPAYRVAIAKVAVGRGESNAKQGQNLQTKKVKYEKIQNGISKST